VTALSAAAYRFSLEDTIKIVVARWGRDLSELSEEDRRLYDQLDVREKWVIQHSQHALYDVEHSGKDFLTASRDLGQEDFRATIQHLQVDLEKLFRRGL
jgi:hypothetical protein